ncbi:MAG: hypothetical protein RL111_1842 [Pseudomonadota bacterium]
MSRFHAPCALPLGQVVDLPAATVRHMQVLRLQPGDEVDLFTGQGGVHQARIVSMSRQQIQVTVTGHRDEERETQRPMHLAVCMPANDRMDWLVEKATELGVSRITPLMSSRSVLRLDGERAQRRVAHWQGIAAHACAQCGRNRLPMIDAPVNLTQWLAQWPTRQGGAWLGLLSLAPQAQAASAAPWGKAQALCWLIGPEGGFSAEEEALAQAHGATPVYLGERILRVETAALAALVTGQALA